MSEIVASSFCFFLIISLVSWNGCFTCYWWFSSWIDFSLSAWKNENRVTSSDLSSTEIALLQEDLGISEYMMASSCSRQSGNYIPHTYYWSDGKLRRFSTGRLREIGLSWICKHKTEQSPVCFLNQKKHECCM